MAAKSLSTAGAVAPSSPPRAGRRGHRGASYREGDKSTNVKVYRERWTAVDLAVKSRVLAETPVVPGISAAGARLFSPLGRTNSAMMPSHLEGEQPHSFPALLSGPHRRMLQSNCRRRASSRAGVEPESSRSCALAADSRSVFEPTTRVACHGAAPFASNKSLPCVHAMSVPAFDRGRRPGRRVQGAGHAFGLCSLTYHGAQRAKGRRGFPWSCVCAWVHAPHELGITIGAVGATRALHAQRSLNLAR